MEAASQKFSRILDYFCPPHPFYDGFRTHPIHKVIVSLVVSLLILSLPLSIATLMHLSTHPLTGLLFTPAFLTAGYIAKLKLNHEKPKLSMISACLVLFIIPICLLGLLELGNSMPMLATALQALLIIEILSAAATAALAYKYQHDILATMFAYVMEESENDRYLHLNKESLENPLEDLPLFSEFEEAKVPEEDFSKIHVL